MPCVSVNVATVTFQCRVAICHSIVFSSCEHCVFANCDVWFCVTLLVTYMCQGCTLSYIRVCVISESVLYSVISLLYNIHATNYLCPVVRCMSGTSQQPVYHFPATEEYGSVVLVSTLNHICYTQS